MIKKHLLNRFCLLTAGLSFLLIPGAGMAGEWVAVGLEVADERVGPMTGLVFWSDSENAETEAIQLEFSYMLYNDVVDAAGEYDWSGVDEKLEAIAGRGHQAVLRFRFIYPGYAETAVPNSIKQLPDYQEVVAKSEGRDTAFCDWSHPALQRFGLDFHTRFAERYDRDPRLAFVQVGFGLWAEYHIYDGPMELGKTFPSKAYQAKFLSHMDEVYAQTPWSISIDAAESVRTPFAGQPGLKRLGFGLFDDSFMHEKHGDYNQACWRFFGDDRWKRSPAGGEFSYYTDHDQQTALAPNGPHGESFADAVRRFHMSYINANDQPRYQTMERIKQASRSMGYRFEVTAFETDGSRSRVSVTNTGVAPIYYDAYPALGEVRAAESLKGLLPGETGEFEIAASPKAGAFSLACDRLVAGQVIPFTAKLAGP